MHADEVAIDAALVRRLVATQFPQYAQLRIEVVASTGTVNAIDRLGDDLCVRLPRVEAWARDLDKERAWLPRLAPRLSLAIPHPVGQGDPTNGFPFTWAVYRWIDGALCDDVEDERAAAEQLAEFVTELRAIQASQDAPRAGRRPLPELDDVTRAAIAASDAVINTTAAMAARERALGADPDLATPVCAPTGGTRRWSSWDAGSGRDGTKPSAYGSAT